MLLPGPVNAEMILLFEKDTEGNADLDRPYIHEGRTVLLFSSVKSLLGFDAAALAREAIPCQIGESEGGFEALLENLNEIDDAHAARHVIIDPRNGYISRWPISLVIDYVQTIIDGGMTIPELN